MFRLIVYSQATYYNENPDGRNNTVSMGRFERGNVKSETVFGSGGRGGGGGGAQSE